MKRLSTGERSVLRMIIQEYLRAREIHDSFHSAHEGYAVILEELDELKGEIWKKEWERSHVKMTREAIQVAAMCVKFVVDHRSKEQKTTSLPIYSIQFIGNSWCAKETINDDGCEESFCGYGSTPEEALQNIHGSHRLLQRLILEREESE